MNKSESNFIIKFNQPEGCGILSKKEANALTTRPRALTKHEYKVKHKTIFKTHAFTCTCEISYGRGIRTQKPKRPSPSPYR